MAASLIDRLPADKRSRFLQLLSRNANSPGASLRQTGGRRAERRFAKRVGELGIFLIESNQTAALQASVGGVNPPNNVLVTLAGTGMTPATTDITASELDPVTYAGAGAKTITVSVPAGTKGEAVVIV